MKHYVGDLTITEENKHLYTDIESVVGWLYVNAEFNAPVLTSVGGWLDVRAEFDAPMLASVGGWLDVNTEFNAPMLTSVWGEYTSKVDYILGLHWPVLITDNYIRIGCQRHTKERWTEFTDAQISCMDSYALEFWSANKDSILSKAGVQ